LPLTLVPFTVYLYCAMRPVFASYWKASASPEPDPRFTVVASLNTL